MFTGEVGKEWDEEEVLGNTLRKVWPDGRTWERAPLLSSRLRALHVRQSCVCSGLIFTKTGWRNENSPSLERILETISPGGG